jgi:hypothetical protein
VGLVMIRYGIWHDEQRHDYSIIRWDDKETSRNPYVRGGKAVQTGIRTPEKAEAMREAWQAPSPAARVSAAGILLERGWGNAPQPHPATSPNGPSSLVGDPQPLHHPHHRHLVRRRPPSNARTK